MICLILPPRTCTTIDLFPTRVCSVNSTSPDRGEIRVRVFTPSFLASRAARSADGESLTPPRPRPPLNAIRTSAPELGWATSFPDLRICSGTAPLAMSKILFGGIVDTPSRLRTEDALGRPTSLTVLRPDVRRGEPVEPYRESRDDRRGLPRARP